MTNESVVEEWRPVKGFEGCYDVSNIGRVRSLHKRAYSKRGGIDWERNRIMSQKTHKNGYRMLRLCAEGKAVYRWVHRIVMAAFRGESPFGKTEVNHIDGDKANNAIANLEWVSPKENGEHSSRCGLVQSGSRSGSAKIAKRGEAMPWAKLSIFDVREVVRRCPNEMYAVVASDFKISVTTIERILSGATWSHITGIKKRITNARVIGGG